MSFLAVIESSNWKGYEKANTYLKLRVDRSDGVKVVPDMNINITKLNNTSKSYNHFFNNRYTGITFSITVFIKKTDSWNGKKITKVLNDWYINMVPLHVITEAIDVPNGEYIITKNNERKQNYKGSTVWNLELTSYTPLRVFEYKNSNKAVLKAIKKNKKKAKKATVNSKLKKCNYKNIKYSKTKKTVKCVKYMQTILYKKHYLKKKQVDGWFGKETVKALKKFQKNYKNKDTNLSHHLLVSGKLDKKTWEALCKS